jgi:glycosyltransferase 2 family protein
MSQYSVPPKFVQLIRWLITIFLFVILIRFIELEEITLTLVNINPLPLFFAILLLMLDRFFYALRWKMILNPYADMVKVSTLTRITFISTFLSNFLPSALSSDLVRSYFLHKERVDTPTVISSVLIDRFIGFFALLSLSTFTVWFANSRGFLSSDWLYITYILTILTFLCIFLFISPFLKSTIHRLELSRWRIFQQVGRIASAIKNYPWTGKSAIFVIGFTGTAYLSAIFATYLIFVSLGGQLSLSLFFVFTLIVQLAMSIPISIGSLGVHEGAWVVLLGGVGIIASEALVFAILLRTINLAVSLPGGYFYAVYKPQLSAFKEQTVKVLSNPTR